MDREEPLQKDSNFQRKGAQPGRLLFLFGEGRHQGQIFFFPLCILVTETILVFQE